MPADPEAKLTLLPLEPGVRTRPGLTPALPVDYWFNGDFAETLSATQPYTYTSLQQMFEKGLGTRTTYQFVSPDGSLFIPTNAPIVQGEPYFGTKWAPVLEAYGLVKGTEGKPFYATNEAEQRTYRGLLDTDGSLSQITTFVEQGGESLAQDADGNVYLAAGQIFAYSPGGKAAGQHRRPRASPRHPLRRQRPPHPLLAQRPFSVRRPHASSRPIARNIFSRPNRTSTEVDLMHVGDLSNDPLGHSYTKMLKSTILIIFVKQRT